MLRTGITSHDSLPLLIRLLDVSVVILAGWLAFFIRFQRWSMSAPYFNQYLLAILLAALLTALLFRYWALQSPEHSVLDQAGKLLLAWGVVALILILIAAGTKTTASFSRYWMILWFIGAWAGMVLIRILLAGFPRHARKRGWYQRYILIVGAGELGQMVAQRLHSAPWTGLQVQAFWDILNDSSGQSQLLNIPVMQPCDLTGYLSRHDIDEIWLALPLSAEAQVRELLYELRHSTATVRFIPDIFGFRLLNHAMTHVAGIAMIDLAASPMQGINRLIKAVEDWVLALLILVLVSPLFLLIAITIKLDSKGSVFFLQTRHGSDGKPIRIYKFRSMYTEQDKAQGKTSAFSQAKRNDPRVTRIGALLRRTSLDELPQFINVLQGRMSIVGPRPHPIQLNEQYMELIDSYMQRHRVKPGITGWAQVNGLRGETDTLEKMQQRIEYDFYYIEHWSLWFDLKIILLTLLRWFPGKNAY